MDKKVVVITLNYNQNDYTIKCINSLLSSSYKNFIILLIDNGSTEENYLQLERDLSKDSRLILERIIENRGYVGGINSGFEEGTKLNPDYFLIMNNDTIIDEKAMKELVNACKDYNNQAIITGKVYYYYEPNKLEDIGFLYKNKNLLTFNRVGGDEIDNGQYDKIEERDLIDDVFWLFPIDLYKNIGGYSPYYWFNGEQADFAIRAKNVGYKLIYIPQAKLWHKGSASIGGRDYNPNQVYWTIQSSLILRYINLKKFYFFIYYFQTIGSIIITLIKSFFLRISNKRNLLPYARAKILGLNYFNKWVIKKNKNTGINPLHK